MTTRALVLGGGGPVGIAWESGLLAGLEAGGVDVSNADFVLGTSAGSAVGAQLRLGRSPAQMHAAIAGQAANPGPTPSPTRPAGPAADTTPLMKLMEKAASGEVPADEMRREIGRFALAAKTISEEDFIATFGRMVAMSDAWPERRYACTAVDAESGEFKVWDNDAGVPLNRAVASSCSVPGIYPPITINGRRYMDGGMRSGTSADLAKGYEVALVVVVTTGVPGPMAERSRARLDDELSVLRDSGTTVHVVSPDTASVEAFGINLMDFSRRGGAAAAGLAQGKAEATKLASTWA